MSEAIERRLDELRQLARDYAKAEAERTYLEHYRKSKVAILMKKAAPMHKTAAAQEREALSDPEYLALLQGLRVATEEAESKKWQLKIAERGSSLWQTQQSTMRAELKAYGVKEA